MYYFWMPRLLLGNDPHRRHWHRSLNLHGTTALAAETPASALAAGTPALAALAAAALALATAAVALAAAALAAAAVAPLL